MADLKPCPFCGHKAKLNARQQKYCGRNMLGTPKLSWTIYVKCNKCHSRGKPITTEPIPLHDDATKKTDTGNWWSTEWAQGRHPIATENFRPYVEKAIEAWNRRVNEPKSKTIILCNINDVPCNDCQPVCSSRKEIRYD